MQGRILRIGWRECHLGGILLLMIALIQRVSRAQVDVAGVPVGAIERGILALIGVEADDTATTGDRLLERILTYRIFPDAAGRMNQDLGQVGGGLLLVPQFTLVADTSRGPADSASGSARNGASACSRALRGPGPDITWRAALLGGRRNFGAEMQVSLTNDGPVTFNLRVPPPSNLNFPGPPDSLVL
jgi:D-tyrosyl-tRNA(Tyr) deacylase